MLVSILLFIVGITLLLLSTEKLVKIAETLSFVLKISPLIIGVVFVSIGTSLPELAVSGMSAIQGDDGLAIGNILGSHIINILLVFPVGILLGNLKIGTTKTQRNSMMLVAVTVLFVVTRFINLPHLVVGGILLFGAVLVSFVEYRLAVEGRNHEDRLLFRRWRVHDSKSVSPLLMILLFAGVVVGGILVVSSLEELSEITGISTTIFGLTLIAAVTSLPELLTTIYSQKEDQGKITIGNIIGSNIYNLLLIGGIVSCFSTDTKISIITWVWLLATTLGLVGLLRVYNGKVVPRWVGVVLLLFFVAFILTQRSV